MASELTIPERPKALPAEWQAFVDEISSLFRQQAAELEQVKRERDDAYRAEALAGNRLGDRYDAYAKQADPKQLLTFSGWINKRISDAEATEAQLQEREQTIADLHTVVDLRTRELRVTEETNNSLIAALNSKSGGEREKALREAADVCNAAWEEWALSPDHPAMQFAATSIKKRILALLPPTPQPGSEKEVSRG